MSRFIEHRRARSRAWVMVLGLHLLLWLVLSRLAGWPDRAAQTNAQPPLIVRLLTLPPMPSGPAARPRLPTRRPPPPAPGPAEPQAITLPAAPSAIASPARAPAPAPTAPTAASAASAAAAALPPLNLDLPRSAAIDGSRRNPALDDPRSNSARATLESRIGAAMNGGADWAEERVDVDHIRFRKGHTCIDLFRSRADVLDPFNRSVSPKPWTAGKEQPC